MVGVHFETRIYQLPIGETESFCFHPKRGEFITTEDGEFYIDLNRFAMPLKEEKYQN